MTISTVTAAVPYAQYTASASQVLFSYPFPIFTGTDLLVYLTPNGQVADDISDLITYNVDYTVQDAGNEAGGTITLLTPATAGDIITIKRQVPEAKNSIYQNGETVQGGEINTEFNKIYMLIQDLYAYIDRIQTKYPTSAVKSDDSLVLPLLPEGYFWQGGPLGSLVAVESSESDGYSTLRSELAVETPANAAGANLVGYNSSTLGPTTVRDALDSLTGSTAPQNSILDFGGDNTGTSDNTAAFNAALTYFAANTDNSILYFPAGIYRFDSKPDLIDINLVIAGQGTAHTTLLRNYTEATPEDGFLEQDASQSIQVVYRDFTVRAENGTSGGTAIKYNTDASHAAVVPILSSIRILEDGGTFSYGLYCDGLNNSGGINQLQVNNLLVTPSVTTVADVQLDYVTNAFLDVDIANKMTITGDASNKSESINVRYVENGGSASTLAIGYADKIVVMGSSIATVQNTSSATNVTIFADVTTKQLNSTSFEYIAQSDFKHDLTTVNKGYQKLPGGLIMQWFYGVTVNSHLSTQTVLTLPIPFTTSNFGCVGFSGGDYTIYETAKSLSSITLVNSGNFSGVYNLIVMGY